MDKHDRAMDAHLALLVDKAQEAIERAAAIRRLAKDAWGLDAEAKARFGLP